MKTLNHMCLWGSCDAGVLLFFYSLSLVILDVVHVCKFLNRSADGGEARLQLFGKLKTGMDITPVLYRIVVVSLLCDDRG